jgi:hypothetical protein
MGDALESTLAALFTGGKSGPPVLTKGAPQPAVEVAAVPVGATPGNVTPELHGAAAHYNRALQALRQGDWAEFGAEMQKLGLDLGQPAPSMHH